MVAMLLSIQNNVAAATERYELILELDPEAAIAANNLAYTLAQEDRDLDRALGLAQTARAQSPDDPDVIDTLGFVLYKRGLAALAIPILQESVQADPDSVLYRYHLALAYVANEDESRATGELGRVIARGGDLPEVTEARRLLATLRTG